jgi:hypothetical protein
MLEEEAKLAERDRDTCWETVKSYTLILWDGSGFFGLKTYKLDRIRGKTVGFLTKCMDCEFVVTNGAYLAIILYVLISEASTYGTMKSQTVNLKAFTKIQMDY